MSINKILLCMIIQFPFEKRHIFHILTCYMKIEEILVVCCLSNQIFSKGNIVTATVTMTSLHWSFKKRFIFWWQKPSNMCSSYLQECRGQRKHAVLMNKTMASLFFYLHKFLQYYIFNVISVLIVIWKWFVNLT